MVGPTYRDEVRGQKPQLSCNMEEEQLWDHNMPAWLPNQDRHEHWSDCYDLSDPLSEVKMISQIWQIFRRRRFPWMTTKAYSKILRRNILSFLDQCITSLSVIYTVQTPHLNSQIQISTS